MAGKSGSSTLLLLGRPLSSFRVCSLLSEVECSLAYGMKCSCNNIMYFVLPKCACILLRRNLMFFGVILYLYYGYFIRFWNQINILRWNGFHCSSSHFYQSQLIMNIETLLYCVHYSNWLFLNSNQDQRWKRDSSHSEDISSTKVQGSMNIFSNDGSFLDQFKKLSGVKGEQEHCR